MHHSHASSTQSITIDSNKEWLALHFSPQHNKCLSTLTLFSRHDDAIGNSFWTCYHNMASLLNQPQDKTQSFILVEPTIQRVVTGTPPRLAHHCSTQFTQHHTITDKLDPIDLPLEAQRPVSSGTIIGRATIHLLTNTVFFACSASVPLRCSHTGRSSGQGQLHAAIQFRQHFHLESQTQSDFLLFILPPSTHHHHFLHV